MTAPRHRHHLARALAAAAVFALALGVAIAGAAKVGDPLTVQVLSAKVMKAPKLIGASVASVSRGDVFTVREVKGDWYRVDGAAAGWIHKSNVVGGKVKLSSRPGAASAGGDQSGVELAGRGFDEASEHNYHDRNPTMDFSHVDAIEQVAIDPDALQAFVDEGGLAGAEGGGQ